MIQKALNITETLAYGTHQRVLSKSFPMNTNMTGFLDGFQKYLRHCALDENSFSIADAKLVYIYLTRWMDGSIWECNHWIQNLSAIAGTRWITLFGHLRGKI